MVTSTCSITASCPTITLDSSDGIEVLIYLLFRLVFHYPAVGVPLLIVIGVALYYGSKETTNQYRAGVIRRGAPVLNRFRAQQGLEELRKHDSDFAEQPFLDRVRIAFHKIQEAWSVQNLDSVRPFISDGIFERFTLQFSEQRDEGYRNVMESVAVQAAEVAEVIVDEPFQWLTVRIRASAVDYRVNIATGKEIRGSRRPDQFAEFWTFLRRNHAQTRLNQNGLIEGDCPNCGAAIEIAGSARCASCESLLRSGQHDWVLCEITQPSEWDSAQSDRAPGLSEYRARHDAGFNAQQLEDRASVIFWRKAMADRLGRIEPLEKMASDELCDVYAKQLAPRDDGRRQYYGDCAVGAVILRGVIGEGDPHRALVEIRWSGKKVLRQPDGRATDAGESVLYRSMFVLARRRGVLSNIDAVLSSSHCPNCGAPEENLAAHACQFCGTVLNNGRHDWVLVAIHHMNSEKAESLLREARTWTGVVPSTSDGLAPEHSLAAAPLLAWLIKTALADVEVDAKERALLHQVGVRRQLTPEAVDQMISAARDGNLETIEPRDRQEALDWLSRMTDLSLADGKITRGELALLEQAGSQLNMGRYDLEQLVKRRRAAIYRASRDALRKQKQTAAKP
jgi:uncharacterized tellurite resistance protein B-like protein